MMVMKCISFISLHWFKEAWFHYRFGLIRGQDRLMQLGYLCVHWVQRHFDLKVLNVVRFCDDDFLNVGTVDLGSVTTSNISDYDISMQVVRDQADHIQIPTKELF
mmetsp:Transcript_14649/g.35334  ORF Transcript_14649/g.35334 Transcript_14649/m.35334 type:complete len:105 (+) Transcript_14649:818-1132(+)